MQFFLFMAQKLLHTVHNSSLHAFLILSSPEPRHSSGSALPLHLLPGGGANGQQGRQQHPRFFPRRSKPLHLVNSLVSVVAEVTFPEQPLLAQRQSLRPPSYLLRALPSPLIGLLFKSDSCWFYSSFISQVSA